MAYLRYIVLFAPVVLLMVLLTLLSAAPPTVLENRSGFPEGYAPVGAATPEDAAKRFFAACAARSPKRFSQVLLLGVCDGPVGTLNKYAECLHKTKFSDGKNAVTVYELPKSIREETARVVALQPFDSEDEDVAALQFQMMSTYYGEKFICVDIAADSYDELEYRNRIVVAMVNDRWYAIPRCRSSISFYQIADLMPLTASVANDTQW